MFIDKDEQTELEQASQIPNDNTQTEDNKQAA